MTLQHTWRMRTAHVLSAVLLLCFGAAGGSDSDSADRNGCVDRKSASGGPWEDSAGRDCSAYHANGHCQYPTGYLAEALTASDACCVCGGGVATESYSGKPVVVDSSNSQMSLGVAAQPVWMSATRTKHRVHGSNNRFQQQKPKGAQVLNSVGALYSLCYGRCCRQSQVTGCVGRHWTNASSCPHTDE